MDWMVPLRRLDESQQDVLRQCSNLTEQAKWIEGFAGSGKTVLLVHIIQNYLHKNPNSKVCVIVFTHALIDLIRSGMASEFRDRIPIMTYPHFINKDKSHYDLIVVDEVQDVPENILAAIRKRTNKLVVGGDDAQSIYDSGCSAEQIETILQPTRLKLPIVYRLTRKIINVVKSILPDNNLVTATSGRMEEIQVTLARADSMEAELTWVWKQANRFTEIGHPSVVVLSGHKTVQDFMCFVAQQEGISEPEFPLNQWGKNVDYSVANEHFDRLSTGTCLQYLGNSYGSLEDSSSKPIVYVMTYHSIKGLDFRTVFLPLLTSRINFWRDPDIDRRLFFVGATRSRRDLFMSYHGQQPHPYVQGMPQLELHKIDISNNNIEEADFVF